MAQFASADDFALRLPLPGGYSMDETTRADALLTRASGIIQDEVHQTIALVAGDVLTMPGTNADRIRLPQRPVVSVASVVLDGRTLTEGTDWWLDGNEIQRFTPTILNNGASYYETGNSLGFGVGFGYPNQALVITYTHGYDPIPEPVPTICMEMVVRVWVNPGSVARETVGNTSTVYDNMRFSPSGLLLTDDERRALKKLFGSRALSVAIL